MKSGSSGKAPRQHFSRILRACLGGVLLLVSGQAYAACSLPTGQAGDQVYNGTYNVMQFCNGTSWVSMAGGVSVTITGGGGGGTPAGSTGDIQFNTSGAFDSDTGQLYWDKTNDRMGLGMTSPAQTLDVSGSVRVKTSGNIKLTLDTPATSQQASMALNSNGTTKWLFGKATDDSFFLYDSAASRYDMNVASNGNMALMGGGGNVGIGTTSPGAFLDVSGTAGEVARFASSAGISNVNYLTVGGSRAMFGYDGTTQNTVVQGIGAKGIAFNVNNATFGSGTAVVINTSGNLGIGTTAPNTPLEVSGSQAFRISQVGGTNNPYMEWTRSGVRQAYMGWGAPGSAFNISMENNNALYINASSTTVSGNLTAVAFLYSSDKRLKSDITNLTGDLAKLDQLNPVSFRFTSDPSKTIHLGLIAQDVQKVYPEAVKADEKGFLKLDYPALVGPMVGMLKELKSVVFADHGDLVEAKEEIRQLKADNDNIKSANLALVSEVRTLKAANDDMRGRLADVERALKAMSR